MRTGEGPGTNAGIEPANSSIELRLLCDQLRCDARPPKETHAESQGPTLTPQCWLRSALALARSIMHSEERSKLNNSKPSKHGGRTCTNCFTIRALRSSSTQQSVWEASKVKGQLFLFGVCCFFALNVLRAQVGPLWAIAMQWDANLTQLEQ